MPKSNELHRLIAETGVIVSRPLKTSQVKYFEIRSRRTFLSAGEFVADGTGSLSNCGLIPGIVHLDTYCRVLAGSRGSNPKSVSQDLLHPIKGLPYIQQSIEQGLRGGVSPWESNVHAKFDDLVGGCCQQSG